MALVVSMQQHSYDFRARTVAAAAIATLLISGLPLLAHHGWEGYRSEAFEITGTVESTVSTAGPHASLKIHADGQVWNVVLAPPPRTERAGLKAGMIPVGDTVTAYGHRHKDPKTFEIKTERLRWKDRLFNVYPDRS
jgi:hypothetical protein